MKLRVMTLVLFTVFLSSFVLAADVAYVVRDADRVDSGFMDAFDDFGLSVEVIESSEIVGMDFSSYGLIFVGDERLRNVDSIPGDVPIIVANRYYALQLGVIERGRISIVGSNSPLMVKVGDLMMQVYSQALYALGKNAIPYYYIPHKYKPLEMESQAMTPLGGKMKMGTVVGFSSDEVNKCFFGIAKTEFWTSDARELFNSCIGFVTGEEYVEGGLHDVEIINDYTNSVNGLRIKDLDAGEYLLDSIAVLECGKEYKVDFKTANVGDYKETINFHGVLNGFEWDATKSDLASGETTTTGSKTILIDFAPGDYSLEVSAALESGDDDNPGNNFRVRDVSVVCGD
jgi:hypothetical protein